MSTRANYTIEDVVDHQTLQILGIPEERQEKPDAEVVRWDDFLAVTTSGSSIAASMDRFKAGEMTEPQFSTLEGFYNEFTENGEQVVFVDDSLKELLGDQAMAVTSEFDEAYAVSVKSPQDALEVIEQYERNYAGDVERDFWEEIDSRHAMVPVMYDNEGLLNSTGISLMGGEGIIQADDGITADDLLEEETMQGSALIETEVKRYDAMDAENADRYVDVLLPPDYEEVDHWLDESNLVIDIDGEAEVMETLSPGETVLGYGERNGIYSLEIGS